MIQQKFHSLFKGRLIVELAGMPERRKEAREGKGFEYSVSFPRPKPNLLQKLTHKNA